MSDLQSLRADLLGSMEAGGFRDGEGQRLTLSATEDATGGTSEAWAAAGGRFTCGLRPVTLRDAERLGATLSEADYSLHADAGTPLSPQDRVTVTDPRHPDGVTLNVVRVQSGRVKLTALCQGVRE